MKNITTLTVRNRKFYIVSKLVEVSIGVVDEFYCAIEDKYVDESGHLIQTLNGIQMCANKDLNATLNEVKDRVELDYMMSQGMSLEEAIGSYYKSKMQSA